jgi:protein-disulfide isomerase
MSLVARHPRASLVVAVAVGLTVSALLRLSPPGQRIERTPVVQAVLNDPGSPAVGASSSDVTVVVFTDYQCPICRATDPALEAVRAHDPRLRVIYKDWPIFGEASKYAARVALAADRQGKYVPVHIALMQARPPLDAASVRDAAISAGADWPRIEAVLAADKDGLDRQLGRHATQAWSLGLAGTPAYLVGYALFQGGMSEGALKRAISHAREHAWSLGSDRSAH